MTVSSNKTIFKNTIMLYLRQVLSLFVSLYTVRVVLDVLGVEDYGIYNVIGGIVVFFTFLKGTMASATQRFFSFALGQNNIENLRKTFSVNLIIYGAIAVLSLILLEVVGIWFVKDHLKLPLAKIDSAIFIYHFSVLTFFFTIFSTPFMSAIIAHEDMKIYAYVSIAEVLLKLIIVFLLIYLPWNKLELYGVLVFIVSIVICLIYMIICIKKYAECQIKDFYWDKKLFNEILGFTGWTLFGQVSTSARNEAVTILLNQFYNPIVVAGSAIARNISGQIQLFSNNFNSSLYPPIIKSYSINDKKTMFSLIYSGSKITFFLMWIFGLPFFIEMDTILSLWLKKIPAETILFTRLALVEVLINSISLPIQTAARAPGKMKMYELLLGLIQLAIFVSSWIALKYGSSASIVFIIAIIANVLMFITRLLLVRYLIGLPLKFFVSKVVIPVICVSFLSGIPSFIIQFLLPKGLVYSFLSILISVIFISVSIYYIGLDKIWRDKLKEIISRKLSLKK